MPKRAPKRPSRASTRNPRAPPNTLGTIFGSLKSTFEKNCDLLIANDVSNQEIGFDSDFNEVSILYKNGEIEKISKDKKSVIANKIVKKIVSNLD